MAFRPFFSRLCILYSKAIAAAAVVVAAAAAQPSFVLESHVQLGWTTSATMAYPLYIDLGNLPNRAMLYRYS